MERKKTPVYVLGALVIGIWGIIIYRITANRDSISESQLTKISNIDQKAQVPLIQPDTFSLLTNERDPFAENQRGKDTMTRLVVKRTKTASPQVNTPSPFQSIRYVGYIRNETDRKRIALINKEGKDSFIEEGGFFDKMKLIAVLKDSIKVSHNGKITFIRRDK